MSNIYITKTKEGGYDIMVEWVDTDNRSITEITCGNFDFDTALAWVKDFGEHNNLGNYALIVNDNVISYSSE